MSSTQGDRILDLQSLQKELVQFVADIAGSQRQIDLDLIASLEVNTDFLNCINVERKKAFYKVITDPDIEPEEYLTWDFGVLDDIEMDGKHMNVIPEDVHSPLNLATKRIMRKFRLPPHFYVWTITWLDKGVKPKHLPAVVDLDVLVRSKEYLNTKSGLPTDTKKKLKRLFIDYVKYTEKSKDQRATKAVKQVASFLDKIPKNVFRRKPILKGTIELDRAKNSSYSDIAFSKHYEETGDFAPEDEVKIKRVSNKLRKRKSHYIGKVKKL